MTDTVKINHLDEARKKSMARRAEMKAAGIVIRRKSPIEKLAEKPQSLRLAVTARCYQCEGEDADPHVQWRIGNCACDDCALHGVRPYQRFFGTKKPKSLEAQ